MKILQISVLFILIFFSSCGNSPLFHHDNEGDPVVTSAEPETTCLLLFPQSQLCAYWRWEDGPQQGENRLRLFFSHHENHQPAHLQYNLNIEVWMPSMGHGSLPTQTTLIQPGEYLIENIFLFMPGEWDIRIQFIEQDGHIIEQNSFKIVI